MAALSVPVVEDNADGWGPVAPPERLKDIPYAPYGKNDKLGKAADWTMPNFQRNFGRHQTTQPGGVFNFFDNEEEGGTFTLVDNKPVRQHKFGQRRFPRQREEQGRDGQQNRDHDKYKGHHQPRRQQHNNRRQSWWREPQKTVVYSPSVDIQPAWNVVEEITFPSLSKLSRVVEEPQDLVTCGSVEFYDKSFDIVSPKMSKPLIRTMRIFRSVTTSDDPVMRRLASEDKGKIFVTDQILTTMMCATRSVYSWDVVVTRIADKIFFDKRDQSTLSLLTVNETAPDPVLEEKDNINGVQQLSLEATMVNQNFSQQVLRTGRKHSFVDPNPFVLDDDPSELASCGYRYRKWKLSDNDDMDVIVRCEVDASIEVKDKPLLVSLKALNEASGTKPTGGMPGAVVDWRKSLESQRGAVFATELRNNSNKLAKWTAGALLSGVDMIKLGYVSRVHPKDNQRHVILGMQLYRPSEFADQINLKMNSCWGIVRAIVETCMKKKDGKYLLIKDPNKSHLRLYQIPDDAFEDHYRDPSTV